MTNHGKNYLIILRGGSGGGNLGREAGVVARWGELVRCGGGVGSVSVIVVWWIAVVV